MKITKKIGDEYYTIEDEELDNIAPKTFKELIQIIIASWIMAAILFGGYVLVMNILGYILELL